MTIPNRDNSGPSVPQPTSFLTMRLSPAAYEQIERQCKPLDVGTNTSDLQAAFVLGQQAVLCMLRKDITVPSWQ